MMDDRFKFRAYLKDTQKMIETVLYDDTGWIAIDGNLHYKFPCDDAVLIQSTGRKDETGKLIFEGHIVEFEFHENVFHGTMRCQICRSAVIYDDCCFVLNVPMEGCENAFCRWPMSYFKIKNIVVIGNIHENPELLTS